jgi:dTMP kinase
VAVTATREPGGTPLGEALREVLLRRDQLELDARAEALLMCASRAHLVERVIRPALDRGEAVVCDRFADSTLAYQGYGRGLDLDELRRVIAFATGGLRPDLVVLLDLPPAAGLARKRARPDRFEAEDAEFHARVREGYHALAATDGDRWLSLDARERAEVLADVIWGRVAELMGLP